MEQLSRSAVFFFFYVCILIYFPLAPLSEQTIMPLMGSCLFMNLLCLYYLPFFSLYEAINYIRISFLARNLFGVLLDHQNSEVDLFAHKGMRSLKP